MDNCPKEKKQLIEEVGLHFEQVHNISPLAARIYAMMILSPADGHTFEEIVETSGASKSSVSTQLNILVQVKKVDYFTKPGSRKRYFRASKMYLKKTLEDYEQIISEELGIIKKITDYNKKYNTEKFKEHGETAECFKSYLNKQYKNVQSTIEEMDEINQEL